MLPCAYTRYETVLIALDSPTRSHSRGIFSSALLSNTNDDDGDELQGFVTSRYSYSARNACLHQHLLSNFFTSPDIMDLVSLSFGSASARPARTECSGPYEFEMVREQRADSYCPDGYETCGVATPHHLLLLPPP